MSNKILRYVVAAIYGLVMASLGVTWQQPAFWVGMVYGILTYIIGYRESTEERIKG